MTQGRLAQLRRLIEDAAETPASEPALSSETQQRRAFQHYEFNTGHPALEQSPRARAIREITRIATWYDWVGEIERALDVAGVTSLPQLNDANLGVLLRRMQQLEECVQTGVGAPDAPPGC